MAKILTIEEGRKAIRDMSADESTVTDLINGADEAVADYLGYDLDVFDSIPYPIKNAAKLYCAANYEYTLPSVWLDDFRSLIYPYRPIPPGADEE